MFPRVWTMSHSFFHPSQVLHRFVLNKVFITACSGARSIADGKKTLQYWNTIVSTLQLCFIALWIHCCACLSSTVSLQVNVPSCVRVPWNNTFSGYHFVPLSCFPLSTDVFYCQ